MEYIRYYTYNNFYLGSNKPVPKNIMEVYSWINSGNYIMYDNTRYDNSNIQELIKIINTV